MKRLEDEANKICEATEDLQVKQEMHRFLIGREGSYVRKLQEESGGCAILFDNNSEVITLAGSKEAIAKAKKLISARVQQLVGRFVPLHEKRGLSNPQNMSLKI